MTITPWQFSSTPAKPRRPHVMLFVFSVGPLRDGELAMEEIGAPSREALATCNVQSIPRGADARWFDAWRSGSLRAIAEQDLGAGIAELDRVDHAHVIACEPGEVSDLTYLQAAWAMARHLVERGGVIVLDAHAMAYTAKLPAAGEALDVRREVRVVYETNSVREDQAHAMHTRGMKKFGAPDLVALCTDADVPLVAHAITELAEAVARGTDLATPLHAVEVSPGVRWAAVEDEHRLGEILQLNNVARVIVDGSGHDLMGVMARLPVVS